MARAWLAAAGLLISVRRRLAWLAWRVGVPGAGLSYAVADDQWWLLRGRLPRYGLATYEHGGEVVVSPCDGTVTEEERRALGLPTRADQRRAAEVQNRLRAEERCRQEGLPDGINLARVWCPTSVAALTKMAAEGASVWRRGEDLTFVHRSRASELSIMPAVQLPMWRVEEDLWALSVRIRDLDQAAISYAFVSSGEPWPATETWRGPLAPPAPRRAAPLAGRLSGASIESRWLGESRRLTVYVPPGEETPPYVVYMTDGQTIGTFAEVVEPLMVELAVPRTVLVGVHSSESTSGEGWRNQEYVPGYDEARFEAHRRFFMEEVPVWAERELGVAAEPEWRAIAGYSSGAVLVSALGCRHPDRVGRVIAFSPGVQPPLHRDSLPAPHYLLAGTLEPGFHANTRGWAKRLRSRGALVELRERVCGHDPLMWEEELPQAISWAFGWIP